MANPKAQSWSIDITVGVVIFIAAFFIFLASLGPNSGKKTESLISDASVVIKNIASEDSPLKIIDENEVNVSRLSELKDLPYEDLKRMVSIEGDFCIYFEDDKGNLVLIDNSYKGIGSPKINLSNTPCSQR